MSVVPPKEELKSPRLEEFCAHHLENFEDLDEASRREATESIIRVCESSDSDSCLVHITAPSFLTSTDEHFPPKAGWGAAISLSDADVQRVVRETLEFLNKYLVEIPVKDHPIEFRTFLEKQRHKFFLEKGGGAGPLEERFKVFMMFTTAKEYVMRKWRK